MNVSYKWLCGLIEIELDVNGLSELLISLGLNVEGITPFGDDYGLDVELTANRPDWLGHIGIARELSARLEKPLRLQATDLPLAASERIQDATGVTVQDVKNCPYYTGVLLRGLKVGPSPAWLCARLTAVGQKPINNVVDVTNYVMLETGEPLHAFDFNKLIGKRVLVRPAKAGEEIWLLENAKDGKKTKLDPARLVIADEKRPIALAGVMGGVETAISETTTDVFLEAATFDKLSIRATRMALNMTTDSSYRFERGVDPAMVLFASKLATRLLLETAGGKRLDGVIEVGENKTGPIRDVSMRYSRMRELLGFDVAPSRVAKIFEGLGLSVLSNDGEAIQVRVPSHRPDLEIEADLIEEVVRLAGYDRIPETPAMTIYSGRPRQREELLEKLRDGLVSWGFTETLGDVFVPPGRTPLADYWTKGEPYKVQNPMNRNADALRTSIAISLLSAVETNLNNFVEQMDLFEIGRIFLPSKEKLPEEKTILGLASIGADFMEMKGVAENVAEQIARKGIKTKGSSLAFLEADAQAELLFDGRSVGYIGVAGQKLAKEYSLREKVVLLEMDLGPLLDQVRPEMRFAEFGKFPVVKRDLALVLDEATTWERVAETVGALKIERLLEISFFDLYRGEAIGEGKKSYAFSLKYGSNDRTLTAEEVEEDERRIVKTLEEKLGAKLRSK